MYTIVKFLNFIRYCLYYIPYGKIDKSIIALKNEQNYYLI